MILSQIDALLIGKPKPFRADGTMSAMARNTVDRPVFLRKHGFEGDEVADLTVHGGADKAVHFYPAEHYPKWIAHFADEGFVHPLLDQAGAFGENISASGLTEDSLRIGDRFRILRDSSVARRGANAGAATRQPRLRNADKLTLYQARKDGPPSCRGPRAGSFTHWIFGGLLATPFPRMVTTFAPGYVFLFFCGMMILQLVWVKTMVTET